MSRRYALKHAIIGLAVSALFLLAVCMSVRYTVPKVPLKRIPDNPTRLYPSTTYAYTVGSAELKASGFFVPRGDDPQIQFFPDGLIGIGSLRITLKSPAKKDIPVEVYYAQEGESLSEERVLRCVIPESALEMITDFPAAGYKTLRLDINGSVVISSIEVSDRALELVYPHAKGILRLLYGLLLLALAMVLYSITMLVFLKRKLLPGQVDQAAPSENGLFIIALLFLGVVLRFIAMGFGWNYDFESYCIVGKIAGSFRSVYAETTRYNYGPVFFFLQGLLYRLSLLAGDHWMSLYRVLIVSLLTLTDLGITAFLARRYSLKAAILFFLNPVSIFISGYHNQFDNIAILFGLLSIPYFNSAPEINKRDIAFVFFFALSLTTKHILFFVPVFILLSRRLPFKKKVLYAILPPGLFLMSFIPFVIGNPMALKGVVNNVFLYRSFNNAPLFHALLEKLGLPGNIAFVVYVFCLLAVAYIARNQDFDAALLIYLISMVTFSSAIANQYLAIPMAALCALNTGFGLFAYMVATGFFLILSSDGLHMLSRLQPGEFASFADRYAANGYSIIVWLLLLGLIWLFILRKSGKPILDKGSMSSCADDAS